MPLRADNCRGQPAAAIVLAVDVASGIGISMRDIPFAVRAGLAPLGFVVASGLAPAAAAQANAQASLSTLARLLLGTVDGKSTGMSGVTRLTGGIASSDAELNTACRELTRAGPFTLDAATRFEGCSVSPGKRVLFRLSLLGVDATREGTVAFMASARPVLERGICRNADVPVLGRLGVTLNYRYTGIGGQPLGEVTIAPDRCGPK